MTVGVDGGTYPLGVLLGVSVGAEVEVGGALVPVGISTADSGVVVSVPELSPRLSPCGLAFMNPDTAT